MAKPRNHMNKQMLPLVSSLAQRLNPIIVFLESVLSEVLRGFAETYLCL